VGEASAKEEAPFGPSFHYCRTLAMNYNHPKKRENTEKSRKGNKKDKPRWPMRMGPRHLPGESLQKSKGASDGEPEEKDARM